MCTMPAPVISIRCAPMQFDAEPLHAAGLPERETKLYWVELVWNHYANWLKTPINLSLLYTRSLQALQFELR